MKITEIYEPILNALREKEFVGNFIVTIYHDDITEIKISGYKPNTAAFPYDFSCELQNKINEICYRIVCGAIKDYGFTFDIKGQITYSYVHGEAK